MEECYRAGDFIRCEDDSEAKSILDALSSKGYGTVRCHWNWIRVTSAPKAQAIWRKEND